MNVAKSHNTIGEVAEAVDGGGVKKGAIDGGEGAAVGNWDGGGDAAVGGLESLVHSEFVRI